MNYLKLDLKNNFSINRMMQILNCLFDEKEKNKIINLKMKQMIIVHDNFNRYQIYFFDCFCKGCHYYCRKFFFSFYPYINYNYRIVVMDLKSFDIKYNDVAKSKNLIKEDGFKFVNLFKKYINEDVKTFQILALEKQLNEKLKNSHLKLR